jgi:hypothetical protein
MILLKITDSEALETLAKVEGADWFQRQTSGEFGNTGLPFLKAAFEKYLNERKPGDSFNPGKYSVQMGFGRECCGTIYGARGFNRYCVQDDGRIQMIEMLARCDEDIAKAKQFGIETF